MQKMIFENDYMYINIQMMTYNTWATGGIKEFKVGHF